MIFLLQLIDKNRKPESLHFKGLIGFFYSFLLQKSGNMIKQILICLIFSQTILKDSMNFNIFLG
ncbi:hypothetical protein BD412_000110 [Thermoanaerobacterium thermosaccharolyticum]|nr:hypothetical protein [Thermoanaerobacterium thermosaccharolyticum]